MTHIKPIALAALSVIALGALASCEQTEGRALSSAQRITSNTQLVGGPAARGEIGDYLMENDKIRVVIQDKTYNRGSGLFGGSLIDADLKRSGDGSSALGGNGRDSFGELFPAFFLEVVEPEEIEVVSDGSDGGASIVEVRGRGGEFVSLLRVVNQVMVNSYAADANVRRGLAGRPPLLDQEPQVRFTIRYILDPGARHVRIESSIENTSFKRLEFPNTAITALLSSFLPGLSFDGFTVPAGHVVGLGKLNKPFLPGIGYNLQFGLLDAYEENDVPLPALPGHLTPMIGTSSKNGISYGFAMDAPSSPDAAQLERAAREHFVYAKDQQTPEGGDSTFYKGRAAIDDMLFLFYASGFGGVFTHQLPPELGPSFCVGGQDAQATCDASFADADDISVCVASWEACKQNETDGLPSKFTFTNYLIVGSGDVSSVWDELYAIKGQDTRRVAGRILDGRSAAPVGANVSLLVYKAIEGGGQGRCAPGATRAESPTIWNQVYTQGGGLFDFTLAPGDYCYRTVSGGRPLGGYVPFTVATDQDLYLEPIAPASSRIEVWSVGSVGEPLPAKITLVGTHELMPGMEKRDYLYDLDASEPWRTSDMVEDTEDASTRRYIEKIEYIDASGQATIEARPGTYEVWVSRGPEYEPHIEEVVVGAGGQARVQARLVRSVDTTGWLSADFHVHARGSIDSGLSYRDRVLSAAAEGLEIAVSTDHNYVSDFKPYIIAGGYETWLNSLIGLELTTFEAGHFNAFPLAYDIESANRGSFEWQNRPPGLVFEELRNRGTLGPDDTIIQVNHPRDSILGYFSQHNVDPFTSDVDLPFNQAEGTDAVFAAIASANGPAFYTEEDNVYTTTFSWNFDAIEIFNGKRFELLESFRASRATLEPLYVAHYTAELLEAAEVDYDPEACATARDAIAACAADACPDERATVTDCDAKEASVSDDAAAAAASQLERVSVDGEVIVCEDGSVAFPGHLDDWYATLNYDRPFALQDYEAEAMNDPARVEALRASLYRRYTATGNSDSHGARGGDEVGTPRNWIHVGHDNPAQMTAREVVTAVKEHRVIVSNGPFVDISIDGQPMGSEVTASSGAATMTIRVAAAKWVAPNRYEVIENGEVIEDGEVTLDASGEWTKEVALTPERDSWYIVRVTGDESLFPIVSPSEIPPFDLNAAIGGLAEPFGFGAPPAGLPPELTFPLKAYAFTNPIWVVADGDGSFDPPAPPVQTCDGVVYDPNNLASFEEFTRPLGLRRADAINLPFDVHQHSKVARLKGERRDVRLLFESWSGCRH